MRLHKNDASSALAGICAPSAHVIGWRKPSTRPIGIYEVTEHYVGCYRLYSIYNNGVDRATTGEHLERALTGSSMARSVSRAITRKSP